MMQSPWMLSGALAWMLGGVACTAQPAKPGLDAGVVTASVEVVGVSFQVLESTTTLEGELAAFEDVAVRARVSGYVRRVLVDRGSLVKAGQPMIVIEAPELAEQRAELDARVQGAQTTLSRLSAAAQTAGAVAGHDLELAKAAVEADTARLHALQAQERFLTVSAPFDGVVTERNVHPGALVGPQAERALLRVQQISTLRLTVAVPELWVGAITEGAEATFTVRAYPSEHFTATIRRVSHAIDPKTRAMAVELDVDNAGARLAPGMFATVTWPVRRPQASAFVPVTSIVQSTERTFVAKVNEGIIEAVTVQRGAQLGDRAEVFGALREGDLVVKRGNEELRTGQRVDVRVKP